MTNEEVSTAPAVEESAAAEVQETLDEPTSVSHDEEVAYSPEIPEQTIAPAEVDAQAPVADEEIHVQIPKEEASTEPVEEIIEASERIVAETQEHQVEIENKNPPDDSHLQSEESVHLEPQPTEPEPTLVKEPEPQILNIAPEPPIVQEFYTPVRVAAPEVGA